MFSVQPPQKIMFSAPLKPVSKYLWPHFPSTSSILLDQNAQPLKNHAKQSPLSKNDGEATQYCYIDTTLTQNTSLMSYVNENHDRFTVSISR